MLVVKIGGPAYRIGMGGGAASSMVSGQNDAELDFNAVQRGDAEMAQKLYRVVRACVEMGENNPIISIHDLGAGGNCNVVKEIIHPEGAKIDIRATVVGDHTMSVLEIWGAEYQEQDAILVNPESRGLLEAVCARERVSMAVIGTINGEGRIVLQDSVAIEKCRCSGVPPPPPAVDLELEKVLGDMPKKTFELNRMNTLREPLDIAPATTVLDSLKRVLRLPSVCSKRLNWRYMLNWGAANKRSLDPKAMARLAVGEALTNLVWAKVTSLSDVKASGNWMYAAKLDGEGAAMYDAAVALSEAMIEPWDCNWGGGGGDSLSMAAQASGEVVKAPGNLVISTYVTCPDITKTVTPDLKLGDDGVLLHIDLAKGKRQLGGSALARVFDQIGDESPDVDDVSYLKTVFNEEVQNLISDELIADGHDISDGGLIVTALEMAFAGNCGISLDLTSLGNSVPQTLFAEELGLLIERICGKKPAFNWRSSKDWLPCVELEKEGLKNWHEPSWKLSFTPSFTYDKYMTAVSKPKVALIREEGSNGDREMAAACYAAGFEPWDVSMSDLLNGGITMNLEELCLLEAFYNRADTFSLGVCNGCQLMALLDWVPGPQVGGVLGADGDPSQPRFVHNESGRFQCCFTSVTIEESPAIMFKGMEGSTFGVWAAHGEGRAYFSDYSIFNHIVGSILAPMKYCDDDGRPTDVYPFNLNGSPMGVAAICSPNGRHLALMPHPERCFMMWQFPWYPKNWDVEKKGPSPWLRMFQNARECMD
ncbi:hypothetical protein K7X08_008929 [Anisodus acutangulus]|uniref:Phosphoribosylformylglycinamidine synthase n=1 Tax=Anisodus acutangulus TaxID=402998 RepID=A0A9Q1MYX6_9SOLA|nr:hypothetical protein K7X08_008929 [Anisodus acutangulus]